jgi:hypothetical protein
MVAKSVGFDQLSGPRTHIDVLIDRFPAPDIQDAEIANKINKEHVLAITSVISDGLCRDWKLESFRFNRDIRAPVQKYMAGLQPAREFHGWSFYRMAKKVIIEQDNELATYQLLGIKPGDTPPEVAGGRVDTLGLFSSPNKGARKRNFNTSSTAKSKVDAEAAALKRYRAGVLHSLRKSAQKRKRGDTDDDQDDADLPEDGDASPGDDDENDSDMGGAAGAADASDIGAKLDRLVEISEFNTIGLDKGASGEKIKLADVPKHLIEAIDYMQGDTKKYIDGLQMFLRLKGRTSNDTKLQCLLWGTKGTLLKMLMRKIDTTPGILYETCVEWVEGTNTRRNEEDLRIKEYEQHRQGSTLVRPYITQLIELYEDCTERGIDITPQQFRRKLLDGMIRPLRAELMKRPDYRTMDVITLTETAESLEEGLLEAGTLRNSNNQLADEDSKAETKRLRKLVKATMDEHNVQYGWSDQKGKGKGKGNNSKGQGKGQGKGNGKGHGKGKGKGGSKGKGKGKGGRGATNGRGGTPLPSDVRCSATVKSLYTQDEWDSRLQMTRDGTSPKAKSWLYNRDRYKGQFVCWSCRTFGDHTMDRCPRW